MPRLTVAILLGAISLLFGAVSANADGLALPYIFTKPAGTGPFPAVVLLHDCSGLGPRSSFDPMRWATRLSALGYVTIAADSFTTRGHPDGVCIDASPPSVTMIERASDAYAALDYLHGLSFVDPKRIAMLGGSHGGSTVLWSAIDVPRNRRVTPGFAAAVALYPGCAGNFGPWKAMRSEGPGHLPDRFTGTYKPLEPLLILIGALDDWTPSAPCEKLAEGAKEGGFPVDIHVYPDARHSFDSGAPKRFDARRLNANVAGGHGATTEGNRADWDDAVSRVTAYLAERMPADQ